MTDSARGEPLTDVELRCLKRIAHGRHIDEVARSLDLSTSTVTHALYRARIKLNARTNAEAVGRAVAAGIVRY